ncbi:unnamed protein product, partial [Meganyctiphanes norvegica]
IFRDMSSKKQTTLSKFFAPKNNSGGNKTDDDDSPGRINKKVVTVCTSPSLKRMKSESPKGESPKAKKLKLENDEERKSSDTTANGESKTLSAGTVSKLESFSYDSLKDTEESKCNEKDEPMQVNECDISGINENKENVVKKIDQNGVRNKLGAFKAKGPTEEQTVQIASTENSDSQTSSSDEPGKPKLGPLKPQPGVKLTPLEQQVVAIKEKNPNCLLFVECGYKYRFFGCDAEIAAAELNIIAHLDHSFMTASIPTHRLHVHVRRLVAKGYKVGVVKQTETAALKAAGNNKGAPFGRELSAIYTRATLIGEDVHPQGHQDTDDGDFSETTETLVVVSESKSTEEKEGNIGVTFLAIQPSTGEMTYDVFDDGPTRTELWSRLDHFQAVEALLPQKISQQTVRVITADNSRNEDCVRLEYLGDDKFDYSTALQTVCQLFEGESERMSEVSGLPSSVVGCLGALLHYLKEFKLDRIIKLAGTMRPYSKLSQHMKLSGATLRNLEILHNEGDGKAHGSLLWALNQTNTRYGSRLLQRWLCQPLLNVSAIEERQDMIQELMTSDMPIIQLLHNLFNKFKPDFEKAITTIFHKKCSTGDFWNSVSGLSHIHGELSRCSGNLNDSVQTQALRNLIQRAIDGLSNVREFANNINEQSAKEGKKTTLFHDVSGFPDIVKRQEGISEVEQQLKDLKPEISRTLRQPAFTYTTVSGLEYLIEVKNANLKAVPSSWKKVSSTKAVCRFRSPEVERFLNKLQQLREQLKQDCHQSWLQVLEEFSSHYQQHRSAVHCLANLDALLSLAKVAKAHGYCRPKVLEDGGKLEIVGGKHPIVSQLIGQDTQYVANDTNMEASGKRVMLVTGPNMGGKSSYMRQVALIALMSQTGSFVPAESACISVLDAIYTRMGATDEIYTGRSTFMVEVGETADIMVEATGKSLVILDELGRGTSTHDGVAVAMASLDYFLNEIKCLTIFVTHYLPLTEFEEQFPDHVGNFHMSFIVSEEEEDGIDVVTFLYQLTCGSAGQSYGLNVARLAQVPGNLIKRAAQKSSALEKTCQLRRHGKEVFKSAFNTSTSVKDLISSLNLRAAIA